MNKQAYLEEVYTEAFDDEMNKIAEGKGGFPFNKKKENSDDKKPKGKAGFLFKKKDKSEKKSYICPKCKYTGNKPGKCPKCDAMMVKIKK